ncbi:probable receptor-like protein kinase At5g20050 [Malania oleifera]|uniref:probable receptor-like protein kinase At5g20050 n=1 Tax=Malania oleifera TaxID=397392 RepID=UPI0025ADD58E|nr:probable receptor-like protein kinase At5g20050 [Malania oleifera]
MEEKKSNIIAALSILVLIILLIVARVSLGLSSRTFYLIVGADIAAIIVVFAYVIIRRRGDRRRQLLERQRILEGRELRIEYSFLRKVAGVPTKFQYKELEEATENFKLLLGQGSSGSVFKGVLKDGTYIAVKRIGGEEHGEKEFRSEVAAIASVQHVNLVHLLGYCCPPTGGTRFLVYEFIPNGSLDCWIFQQRGGRNCQGGCLSWNLRYRVAIDVAKALCYLHHDCRSRILHFDVKPENILLDQNYRALMSDFGLSKLMGKEESRVVTSIRGTRGYLAPEWLLQQGVSEKSDIYSYGMVLLEMLGGRRNIYLVENDDGRDKSKRKWDYFPKFVMEKMKEKKLMEVADQRLVEGEGIDERELRILVFVALWCIQEKAKLRPSMAQVVDMLEGRVAVDEPPETQMAIVDLLSIEDSRDGQDMRQGVPALAASQVGANIPSSSMNSYTMSVLSGR